MTTSHWIEIMYFFIIRSSVTVTFLRSLAFKFHSKSFNTDKKKKLLQAKSTSISGALGSAIAAITGAFVCLVGDKCHGE